MSYFKSIDEIEVWQDGVELSVDVYKITKSPSFKTAFSYADQLKRCSISITSNIAGSYKRYSNKEFIQYLYIAKGSSAELRA